MTIQAVKSSSYREQSQGATIIKKKVEKTNSEYCKSAILCIAGSILVAGGFYRASLCEEPEWKNFGIATSGVVGIMLGTFKFLDAFWMNAEANQRLEQIEKDA